MPHSRYALEVLQHIVILDVEGSGCQEEEEEGEELRS